LKLKSNKIEPIDRDDLIKIFYLLSNDKHEFEMASSLLKKHLKTNLNNSFLQKANVDGEIKAQFDDLLYIFSKSFYDLKLEDVAKNILDDKV
jgi:hypothetical protein